MKKLLLDTHIWIWSVLEPERLARSVAAELENPENELYLSPISIWEVLMLAQKGRVDLRGEARRWITRALRELSLGEAAVTHEVAQEIGRLGLAHRDPADHFLLATAKVFGLTLVTADRDLLQSEEVSLLPNQ